MTLFRKESLHNQRRAWLGSIQLVQPVGLAWLTFWVLATLAVVSTFLFWGEYTRKAHLTGVLVPDRGLIRIAAPVAGTVLALAVFDGHLYVGGVFEDAAGISEADYLALIAPKQQQRRRPEGGGRGRRYDGGRGQRGGRRDRW